MPVFQTRYSQEERIFMEATKKIKYKRPGGQIQVNHRITGLLSTRRDFLICLTVHVYGRAGQAFDQLKQRGLNTKASGGWPAVNRRMAWRARVNKCENAGQAVALAFKVQRSKDDPVRGAILQYLALGPIYSHETSAIVWIGKPAPAIQC
jgi:hypothetical protein